MPIEAKYVVSGKDQYKDVRALHVRVFDWFSQPDNATFVYGVALGLLFLPDFIPGFWRLQAMWDIFLLVGLVYLYWFRRRPFALPFKMPKSAAGMKDTNNKDPGPSKGKPDGIMFLGNEKKKGDEIWLTDSDARTHTLFLGTTGSGKTVGLHSFCTNSLCWGSGFVFVDGKADTGNWANLYALARRFGRDDDLLCINYMTGNSDANSASNSLNPFASGSASYLVQMLVTMMPESGGENAMWKERAVALIGSLMPALTFMRDHQHLLLDIGVVGDFIELPSIVKLSRDKTLPVNIVKGLKDYLKTLPGYVDEAFDDDGQEKPPSPDSAVHDLSVAKQQHGYLSMQFTRSLQSLAGDYGHIFKAQLADVDMVDVVLNRRILVVLIPALEKSPDEAANLGKIVVAAIKGMMGSTLGAQIEGSWETAIENKPTNAASPYITIFDEVGYYTSPGMAVMAAQARSLGFSLIFAAQDLPAMEKRVKEEARSIAGNCNLKIFGKLEDPTGTKKFFEDTVGSDSVMMTKSKEAQKNSISGAYSDVGSAAMETRSRQSYDKLKEQKSGQVTMLFSEYIAEVNMPYINPGKPKALRVQKMLAVPPRTQMTETRDRLAGEIANRLTDKDWSAARTANDSEVPAELSAALNGFKTARDNNHSSLESGIAAVVSLADVRRAVKPDKAQKQPTPAAKVESANDKPAVEKVVPEAAVTEGSRRAPLSEGISAPTEQDIARVQLASAATKLAPFTLPQPDDAAASKLRGIAGSISRRLFADGESKAAE